MLSFLHSRYCNGRLPKLKTHIRRWIMAAIVQLRICIWDLMFKELSSIDLSVVCNCNMHHIHDLLETCYISTPSRTLAGNAADCVMEMS